MEKHQKKLQSFVYLILLHFCLKLEDVYTTWLKTKLRQCNYKTLLENLLFKFQLLFSVHVSSTHFIMQIVKALKDFFFLSSWVSRLDNGNWKQDTNAFGNYVMQNKWKPLNLHFLTNARDLPQTWHFWVPVLPFLVPGCVLRTSFRYEENSINSTVWRKSTSEIKNKFS